MEIELRGLHRILAFATALDRANETLEHHHPLLRLVNVPSSLTSAVIVGIPGWFETVVHTDNSVDGSAELYEFVQLTPAEAHNVARRMMHKADPMMSLQTAGIEINEHEITVQVEGSGSIRIKREKEE